MVDPNVLALIALALSTIQTIALAFIAARYRDATTSAIKEAALEATRVALENLIGEAENRGELAEKTK